MTKKSADINYISKDLFPKTYNRTMIDDDYIKQLEQENKQLNNILTKLKKWLKETRINSAFIDEQTIMEVQLKMLELEKRCQNE